MSRQALITSGRTAGVTMNWAPADIPAHAVSASSTVPSPTTTWGSSLLTLSVISMAPGVVMVSSMQFRPPAESAPEQASRAAGPSARISAMTRSARSDASTADAGLGMVHLSRMTATWVEYVLLGFAGTGAGPWGIRPGEGTRGEGGRSPAGKSSSLGRVVG